MGRTLRVLTSLTKADESQRGKNLADYPNNRDKDQNTPRNGPQSLPIIVRQAGHSI